MYPFIRFLAQRIKDPLPGIAAQLKMAPTPVKNGPRRQLDAPENATQSSVLVLLFPDKNEDLNLILTLRNKNIDHGGQISFPGGRSEPGESTAETALREAEEEIGIPPADIQIIGMLSHLYVSKSNNHVTPVVGYIDALPELKLNTAEVDEAFSVPLESLVSRQNLTTEHWDLRQYTYKVPYWDIHRVPLWGATAMMLSELVELYREFASQPST